MSWLGDAYRWVDANLAGGLLPGGQDVTQPGSTIAGVIPTPFVGIQPAAQPAPAQIGSPALAEGGLFSGGVVQQAAQGITQIARPVGAVVGRGRGRTLTAVATVFPDGTVVPRKMMAGSPVAMSSDISAVKRLKTAKKRILKVVPSLRASKGKC